MVLDSRKERAFYLLRVNPIFLIAYWILWLVPLAIGTWMFITDTGLTWQRTQKVDANHDLVRSGQVLGDDIPERVLDLREPDSETIDVREGQLQDRRSVPRRSST